MLVARCSFVRLPWIGRIWIGHLAVLSIFAAVSVFAQSVPAPASVATPTPCLPSPETSIPVNSTVEANVPGVLDSGHLKVGQEVWVKVVHRFHFSGCALNEGSAVYAHVMSAVSQKNPNSSELSLAFDHADCEGHKKMVLPLRLIALLGPPDDSETMHEQAPVGLQGASRSAAIPFLAGIMNDQRLNPGGTLQNVHPGIVVGMPKTKLEITGGPGCSARISSTNRSIQLMRGTTLFLIE